MSNSAGKGSSPRNCFSEQFRSNYDQIDWSRGRPTKQEAPSTGDLLAADYKTTPAYVIPTWTALRSDLGRGT